jgi:hypothetical protein
MNDGRITVIGTVQHIVTATKKRNKNTPKKIFSQAGPFGNQNKIKRSRQLRAVSKALLGRKRPRDLRREALIS